MSPIRKKIDAEDDFTAARKRNDHERGENVRTAVNRCFVGGVYLAAILATFVVFSLGGVLIWHLIETQDYRMMWTALSYIGTGTGGYVLAYLKSNGIDIELMSKRNLSNPSSRAALAVCLGVRGGIAISA